MERMKKECMMNLNLHHKLLKKIREINKTIDADSIFAPSKYSDYKFITQESESLDSFFKLNEKRISLNLLFNEDFGDCLPLLKNVLKNGNTPLSSISYRPIGINKITKENIFNTICYDYDIGCYPSAALSRWIGEVKPEVNSYISLTNEPIHKHSSYVNCNLHHSYSSLYIIFDPSVVVNKEILSVSSVRALIFDKSGISYVSPSLGVLSPSYVDDVNYFDKYTLQMYFANFISTINNGFAYFKRTFFTVWIDPVTKEKEIFTYEDYLGYLAATRVFSGLVRLGDDPCLQSIAETNSFSSSEQRAIAKIYNSLNSVSPGFLKESLG